MQHCYQHSSNKSRTGIHHPTVFHPNFLYLLDQELEPDHALLLGLPLHLPRYPVPPLAGPLGKLTQGSLQTLLLLPTPLILLSLLSLTQLPPLTLLLFLRNNVNLSLAWLQHKDNHPHQPPLKYPLPQTQCFYDLTCHPYQPQDNYQEINLFFSLPVNPWTLGTMLGLCLILLAILVTSSAYLSTISATLSHLSVLPPGFFLRSFRAD